MRFKRLLVFATALVMLTVPAAAGGASASSCADPVLLASGLQGTIGATIGPDGGLYVPEGGARPDHAGRARHRRGHDVRQWAAAGALRRGDRRRLHRHDRLRPGHAVAPDHVVGIYRVDDADSFTVIADLGAFSVANPPP